MYVNTAFGSNIKWLFFSDCERRDAQPIPDSNLVILAEADKISLLHKINNMKTIDVLNNGFLESFLFSLTEHDRVCQYLHRAEFDAGASCLLDIVERRSNEAMYLLCCLLEQRKETAYIVKRFRLRENYCQTGNGGTYHN